MIATCRSPAQDAVAADQDAAVEPGGINVVEVRDLEEMGECPIRLKDKFA
jgi:hypothetical protein